MLELFLFGIGFVLLFEGLVYFFFAKILAFFLEFLPNKPLTQDQVRLLMFDSVSNKGLRNLTDFVKTPSSLETIVKNYL